MSNETVEVLRAKFATILPHLDERATRLLLGSEARSLGHGGITAVGRATGIALSRIQSGVNELEAGTAPLQGIRKPGAERKTLAEKNPGLVPALLAVVEPTRRGNTESPLFWPILSTANLATELTAQGHRVGAETVAKLLKSNGVSLQANVKTLEGGQHPDRDAQFTYLNAQAAAHLDAGDPVINVDAKKKEIVGEYKNKGSEWRPAVDPEQVKVHDFIDKNKGKANPYGVYDVGTNTGWVSVGTYHDTAAFAVNTIRFWWNTTGHTTHPGANRLLITADGGGSNGYRTRLWKTELAALAKETGLEITVCHLPPGPSKWNEIEHKLFSHISMNWRGRPLSSHEVIVNSIAATTKTGLSVLVELDTGSNPTGVKIPDQEMAELESSGTLNRREWHPEWNYIPKTGDTPTK